MRGRLATLGAFLAAAIWPAVSPYLGEFAREFFIYEWASKMLHSFIEAIPAGLLMQYGPSLVLAGIGVYLFLKTKEQREIKPAIHGRMFPIETGVWVGQIHMSVDKLDSDLFFEIGIVAYNGTTKLISIGSVQGFISFNGATLPEPKLLDRGPTQNLPTAKEFMVVLEQRVPRTAADQILKRLAEKNNKTRVQFDVSKLNIFAFFPPDTQYPARLPIWNTFTVDMEGTPPRVMRSSSIVVNQQIGERRGA